MTKLRIGWIGVGVIGGACASRLVDAGYDVVLTTRTKSKATPLLDKGAEWADSARQVAVRSDLVFSTVGYPDDVRDVFFGKDGVLEAWSTGAENRVYVDMTTSSPELAESIQRAAREHGFGALDAPVSGGDVGAREGRLSIMVGGDEKDFATVLPVFEHLGTNIRRLGGAGAGQRAKTANQLLIAGNMIGVCESLLYAHQAGLNLDEVLASVSTGAAGSWSLSNLGPRILKGDFQPGFYVEHFIKDLGIALDDARRLGLALPGAALARQLYIALEAQGGGKLGTQALVKALASLSHINAF